jgi:hypothetical protein
MLEQDVESVLKRRAGHRKSVSLPMSARRASRSSRRIQNHHKEAQWL